MRIKTRRQGKFFDQIRKGIRPLCPEQWFVNTEQTLDFLQALLVFRLQKPSDEWSRKLVWQLRNAAPGMNPRFLSKLVSDASIKVTRGELVIDALVALFTVGPKDADLAVKMWDLIVRSVSQPDLKSSGTPAGFQLIPVLWAVQDYCYTWQAFLEGLRTGHREANAVFGRLLTILACVNIYPRFVGFKNSTLNLPKLSAFDRIMTISDELNKTIDPRTENRHLIPVPSDYIFCCNLNSQKFCAAREEQQRPIINLISQFEAEEDRYQAAARQMWEEIHTHTEFGIHKDGDTVLFGVEALKSHGYRCLELWPGPSFYEARVVIWLDIADLGLSLPIEFNLSPDQPLSAASAPLGSFTGVLEKLQQFVALQCFWMIITGRLRGTTEHCGNGHGSNGGGKRRRGPRPHFPRLPAGFKPTKYAKDRCLEECGHQDLPEGRTFATALPEEDRKNSSAGSKAPPSPTFRYRQIQLEI